MNIQPLDLGAIDDQVRHLDEKLTQTGNIQSLECAAPADFFTLNRLNNQVPRQIHVQRRQRDDCLLFRSPLNASFPQHNQRAKDRVVLHDHSEFLRPGAVRHALNQKTVDSCLRPGHFDTIENRLGGLLHFRCRTQIKHDALHIRFMRNIRRTKL
ncbi:hypothetical protein D3C71_491110 [compost metagenome]